MDFHIELKRIALRIGRGTYRIELEAGFGIGWFRLPFIGQGTWESGYGWVMDGWADTKAANGPQPF